MGITSIEHNDLFLAGLSSKEKADLAMFRYNKQTKIYLIKCRNQKVSKTVNHNYICLITIIIFMCRLFKVMLSSSRTETTTKYTSIIITDFSTTTKAVIFNV